ncbi:hypothetical protein GCM10009665_33120 [Kitasatospora nipponensis]|uniref:WD40 repeat protein n=1 Tax=Kitasatospora nipponensis TaxID=258049 RepID=A0ABP4GV92_9ACTN
MMAKVPLGSGRWAEVDGVTADEVRQVVALMAGDGDEWREAWQGVADGLMQSDTVYDGAYAALPHLVEAAVRQPAPERFVDLWVDLGFMVTSDGRAPVPADLVAGFEAALRPAERAAVRSLLAAGIPAADGGHLALAAVALAGHHAGGALWRFLDPQQSDLVLSCPGCEAETELPSFLVDPVRPPFEAPPLPDPALVRRGEHPWGEVAEALRDDVLGEGWEPFLRVARAVAAAGVPREASGQAVLCLAAALVAVGGAPGWSGALWARKLMLLTGHFRCPDCERTWTVADCLAEDPGGARPLTGVAQGEAGPVRGTALPTAGRAPGAVDVTLFAAPAPGSREGVNALAVVPRPGLPPLVAGAGDGGGLCLWDADGGRLEYGPLPGHPDRVRAMTTLPRPNGGLLLAGGGDGGTIALWDPVAGQPFREPVGNWLGAVTGMCAATVPGGRTLLVTATDRGAVRLRDPLTGESVGRLNPSGRPIVAVAAVPIAAGHPLSVPADAQGGVHVWDPAVDDPWDAGAAVPLSARALKDVGHRVTLVATASLHGRTLLATADRDGVVLLWDPATGAPVGDGLPPDPAAGPLTALTATTLHDGRDVVVTGSRTGRSVRVWEPESGVARLLALDVAVTCLAAATTGAGLGSEVIVGHQHGVLRLASTG